MRENQRAGEAEVDGGDEQRRCSPACPACGGRLIEIRAKFQCSRCGRICETCCEGSQG